MGTLGQPLELGVVQSADLELKIDLKELRGVYRYPVAVADGKGTCSGKVSFAQIWPATLAAITSGTLSTGGVMAAIDETAVIPSATAYTITLSNAATIVPGSEIVTVVDSQGSVVFYTRGLIGTIQSSSLQGQTGGIYSITGGVLTFIAADAGLTVRTSYLYTPAVGLSNSKMLIGQIGMNSALTFQLTLIGTGARNIYNNQPQQFIVQLNACLAPSLKMGFKLDDWTTNDVDFQAYCDVNGNLGSFYMVNPGGAST